MKTKYRNLIIFFIFISSSLMGQSTQIGIWKEIDEKESDLQSEILILGSESFMVIADGIAIGGLSWETNGETLMMTYEVDYSKSPVHFDVTMHNFSTDPPTENKFFGIVKFERNDKMILNTFNDERPISFEDADVYERMTTPSERQR